MSSEEYPRWRIIFEIIVIFARYNGDVLVLTASDIGR